MNTHKPIPETIYHYTTMDGLIGIFERNAIWASGILHLNDSSEFQHAIQQIAIHTGRSRKFLIDTKNNETEEIYDFFIRMLIKSCTFDIDESRSYITSFSELENDLSQWRAYTNNGIGYCIGFNTNELLKTDKTLNIKQVNYNHSFKEKISNDLLSYIKNKYKNSCMKELDEIFNSETMYSFFKLTDTELTDLPKNKKKLIREINTEIKERIKKIAYIMKDEAFKDEKEWRIIFDTKQENNADGHDSKKYFETKFRAGKSFIIPYIEIPLLKNKNIISEIYIGPTPNLRAARSSLKIMLEEKFGPNNNIKIIASQLPYRAW